MVIVDDHPIWRDEVQNDLTAAGFDVVATFPDAESALQGIPVLCPDVILMDLQLPKKSGVEAVAELVAGDRSIRILMFSSSGEHVDVLAAVTAGARGYLIKSASRDELVAAIHRTAAGRATYSPGLAALVLDEYQRINEFSSSADGGTPRLTPRETEVLRMVAKGLTARQIAERLVVSHRTVQNQVQGTLRKLQLHNKVELTRWALEHNVT